MNRERAKELLPIIQAFAEGKDIERWHVDKWLPLVDDTLLGIDTKYRIKPSPREFVIEIYPSGEANVTGIHMARPELERIRVREVLSDDD